MNVWWWSTVPVAVGLVGSWLIGMKLRVGWVVALVDEVLWVVYGVVTGQPAFCGAAVLYGAVYCRNLRRWRALPRPKVEQEMMQ